MFDFLQLPNVSVCADPVGGLGRPDILVLVNPAGDILLGGVPGAKGKKRMRQQVKC